MTPNTSGRGFKSVFTVSQTLRHTNARTCLKDDEYHSLMETRSEGGDKRSLTATEVIVGTIINCSTSKQLQKPLQILQKHWKTFNEELYNVQTCPFICLQLGTGIETFRKDSIRKLKLGQSKRFNPYLTIKKSKETKQRVINKLTTISCKPYAGGFIDTGLKPRT